MSDAEKFVNVSNTRSENQREIYEDIEKVQICPFCPENLLTYNPQGLLRSGEHWSVMSARWPYEYTDTHLLVIPNYHAESLAEINDDSANELLDHLKWAESEFNIASGGIAMRFGDITLNGASVGHLHMHLIVPSQDKPEGYKVKFKIS